MKYTFIYIALLLTISLNGQIALHKDTIRISEVVISGNRMSSEIPGYRKESLDSSVVTSYSHRTVAEVLSLKSGIFIKSYGMGGTATPAFRGTGAGHTQIAWNGININNPMLGQSDLSLFPVGMTDNIQIYFGGASMTLGSGGIGGTINLETKPDWKNETSATISPGIGSFGTYSGLVSLKTGNESFQTNTRAFYYSAENDFRYLNTVNSSDPAWETRINNQVKNKGLMQELYYRWQKSVLSARIWYQSSDRNLPSSMLIQQQGTPERQSDESVRAMFSYNLDKAASAFYITGAWLMNRLDYVNSLASIDSRNISNSLSFKAGAEKNILTASKLKLAISEELNEVNSNNYGGRIIRNTTALSASVESNLSDRLGTNILVREILDEDKFLIPDFSAGLQFRLLDAEEDILKANISRNSKIPTLNDLYWSPGGNPELKNEYAYIYELTYELRRKISSSINIKYSVSAFRNTIKDMVQWRPGAYSYWTAENIRNVSSMGVETSLSAKYKLNKFVSVLEASYSYTRAYDDGSDSEKNQLMYVPENIANASWQFIYKTLYTSWKLNFTGDRFITLDNTKSLPAYLLNGISSGYKIKIKDSLIDLNLNIDNLFDVYYQSIAYFPLPGRTYSLKLLIQLNK
ncbi:MAG: TonB-dependent receptor plug domain-containing protein [Bacteroidales bacterium]|nr:TonB-dependent receptor plug domain-containing protein [Bacteroidales bacterium]